MIDAFRYSTADADSDGQCSFYELFDWAAPRASAANPRQTAQTHNRPLLEDTVAAEAGTLVPPADDSFEENDIMESAAAISPGSHELMGLDADWFRVSCDAGRLSAEITGPDGDLDLYVFDPKGDVIGLSLSLSSNEFVEAEVDAGNVYVLVYPYEGRTSSYTLTLGFAGESEPEPEPSPAPEPAPEPAPAPEPEPWSAPEVPPAMLCGFGAPMVVAGSAVGWASFVHIVRRRRCTR